MGEIYYNQILILLLQCIIVALLLLGLFRLRSIFGLSLLYTSLGVFQYMQVFLVNSLYFEITPEIIVSSGSAIFFTGSLFAILLVYIKEDTQEARKLIYAILFANIVLSILQFVISIGFEGKNVINVYSLPKEIFTHNIRVLLVGTLLLFLDTFFIIFIYEFISKFIKSLFFRIALSMIFILSIDSILFPIGVFSNWEQIQPIIISGLLSKTVAAIIYAIMFSAYIKFVDTEKIILGVNENNFRDIFQSLTFRQKYEHVVEENLLQKKDLKTSRMRYNYFVERTNEGFFRMESIQPIPTHLPVEIQIKHIFKYMYVAECNEIFAHSYGYDKASDIIGFSFKELINDRNTETENLKALTYFIKSKYKITGANTKALNKQGEERYYINNSIGVLENNCLIAFLGTQRDITEKKKIEIALENEKALLQAIVDNIPIMLTMYNPNIDMLFFNKEFETKIGYTTKEANEINFMKKIYPTEAITKQAHEFMLSESRDWKEFPIITKQGITLNTEWTNIRLENDAQIGIGIDITDRKKAKEKLKKSNSFLINTLENMTDGYVSLNNKWEYTYVNKKAGELFGRLPKELVGKHIWTEFPEGIDQPFYKNYYKAIETQKPIIFEDYFEPWEQWYENRVVPSENGLAIFFQNITERKLAHTKILEEKLKAQQYLNVAGVMLLCLDFTGKIKLINPKGCEILGYTEEEILNKNWFDYFLPKEEIEKVKEISKKVFLGELESFKYHENEIVTKSGKKRLIAWNNEYLFDEKGKIIGVLSSGEDITERKIAEKELKSFNSRLQMLHEIDLDILASKDSNSVAKDVLTKLNTIIPFKIGALGEYNKTDNNFIRTATKSSFSITDLEEGDFSPNFHEIIDINILKEGKIQIIENIRNIKNKFIEDKFLIENNINSIVITPLIAEKKLLGVLAMAAETMDVFTAERIEITKEITNQLAISILQSKLKQALISYTENLEELVKERTAQLKFSNEELKDFAQIVSHDLKAPLRAISQLSHWISEDYSDKIDSEGQEHLTMLVSRAKRMDDLIEGILQYSKASKAKEKESIINLNQLVQDVIISLDPPKNIKITIENKLPEILGDATRFTQVFQNLINNALKFIDKPIGTIKIGCEIENEFWKLYISDNGPGIEEKYFDRIFQIFQRLESRDNQEGTGVGLSLVKKILQIYGGKIWIESTIGEGTTFYFTLPIKL